MSESGSGYLVGNVSRRRIYWKMNLGQTNDKKSGNAKDKRSQI
jgi:hypothetical protein